MGDLVLLRDLIKSSARGQSVDLDILFRRLDFETSFECIIARAVTPCAAEAVARAFHFLGARSAASRADVAPRPSSFTRRYSRRMRAALHIDVTPQSFDPIPPGNGESVPILEVTIKRKRRCAPGGRFRPHNTTVVGCSRPTTRGLMRRETVATRHILHSKPTLCNGKGEVIKNHVVFFDAILSW